MNIDIQDLTLLQISEIQKICCLDRPEEGKSLNGMIGKKVIIRTYSAGVWYGELHEKSGNEVILKEARRMFMWFANEGITLSEISIYGVNHDKSRICAAVDEIWLEAIEIIPCQEAAIISLAGAKDATA